VITEVEALVESSDETDEQPQEEDEEDEVDGIQDSGEIGESVETDDDPGRRQELAHAVVWNPARDADRKPIIVSSASDDPRTFCVKPWLDRLIAQSESDIHGTASFYADDACFSLFFGKLGGEWGHLFASNRNLTMRRGGDIPQIYGSSAIIGKLGTLFEDGLKLRNVTTHIVVVCDLFYAVSMYGVLSIKTKNLAMMRSMVVIGHNRRLFITNDVISLRYDQGIRARSKV
jgi:hypothetical protein